MGALVATLGALPLACGTITGVDELQVTNPTCHEGLCDSGNATTTTEDRGELDDGSTAGEDATGVADADDTDASEDDASDARSDATDATSEMKDAADDAKDAASEAKDADPDVVDAAVEACPLCNGTQCCGPNICRSNKQCAACGSASITCGANSDCCSGQVCNGSGACVATCSQPSSTCNSTADCCVGSSCVSSGIFPFITKKCTAN
jgi:hypothetical protein